MSLALCLIALALGYKVFLDASKEKEGLKLLGQIIGIVVMALALVSAVCASLKCMTKAGCPMVSKAYNCPVSAKVSCPMGAPSSQS